MAEYTPIVTPETIREDTENWNWTLCPRHCNKQCESFPIGSFVFWLSNYSPSGSSIPLGGRYYLCFGEVIAHYSGQTTVQLYDYKTTTKNVELLREYQLMSLKPQHDGRNFQRVGRTTPS